jgi:hypothetical protein
MKLKCVHITKNRNSVIGKNLDEEEVVKIIEISDDMLVGDFIDYISTILDASFELEKAHNAALDVSFIEEADAKIVLSKRSNVRFWRSP